MERIKKIIEWLEDYKNATHCNGVVLGISGGKDSTVVGMLAKKVWGDNVFGVLMPNGEQSDIDDAIEIASTIGIRHAIVNIGTTMNTLLLNIEQFMGLNQDGEEDWFENCPKVTDKAKSNMAPRLRMTTLYAIAQTMGYRVIGTGNASEAYIGWTTKWGDSAYDLNPIYHLTCTDVIEIGKILAKEFGLDEKYIVKTPSDGLTGKSDEDNFGFSYAELDAVINGESSSTEKIDTLHKMSAHKRCMPYTLPSNKVMHICPHCGGTAKILVCDDEGNVHDEDYEEDPWSGLSYAISHDVEDNPNCPIANDNGEILGRYLYNTREEAIEAWNELPRTN